MATKSYDLVVVGSGPGGYVAAIRAAQLGMKVGVVEKEAPGGVCLNWGCIPTKAILKSAEVLQTLRHAQDFGVHTSEVRADFPAVMQRSRKVVDKMTKGVEFLFKKNKIELILGTGRFASKNEVAVQLKAGGEERIQFKNAMIATGARARILPGFPVDGERVITYREALDLKTCPQKMLVIGAGVIGIEFAYFFNAMGTEVTVVEVLPDVLPIEDEEVSKTLERSLSKQGISVKTKTVVESLVRKGQNVSAILKGQDGKVEQWEGDYALVAIGVQGNSENLGLEGLGIAVEKSWVKVDEMYRTAVPNIYAIGDIIGPPCLAHVASHEGIIAVEAMAGQHPHQLDYRGVPGCTYCQPQVASMGLTEKKARETGRNIKVGKFPFTAIGKAVATNETEGFVKVVIDAELEEILGVHIIHPEATELIAEVAVAHSHEAIASSVLNTVHAHPTLSEAVMEAMGVALGRAIHI